jgi:hypothetical protein
VTVVIRALISKETHMRIAALGLAGAIAFALSANAAPIAPVRAHENASNITKVAGGCGRGFHLNGWGRCVPNRYGHYSRPYYRPYYGYRYQPWNRPSTWDFGAAKQLNRQQLRGWGY